MNSPYKFSKIGLIIITVLVFMSSCKALKPYERIYINDSEMQMGSNAQQNFRTYVHAIREGSTTPGEGKGSGGCGCN